MRIRQVAVTAALLGIVSCAGSQRVSDAGIRTTCGSVYRAVTGSHDPTVILSVPTSRSFVVNVSSRREGSLDGLQGRVERAKAKLTSAGAECSARSGSYRFDIRGSRTESVALELIGVGPAQVVIEHDGRVLRRAFVDLSAEERIQIAL